MAEEKSIPVTESNHRLSRIIAGAALIGLGVVYKRWLLLAGLGLIFSDKKNRQALGSGGKSVASLVSSRSKQALEPSSSSEGIKA